MASLILDMTKASDKPFEPITPGFYLLEIERLDDPEEKRNNFFDFKNHPDEQPYEDERGYMQYPTRWSFRAHMRPIADAHEDFEDEDVIYVWCNLNYRRNGKLAPNQETRRLLDACEVSSGNTDELIGQTIWANVGHALKDDGTFQKYTVTGYTKQAPKRRNSRRAAPAPQPEPEIEVPFDGAGDDAGAPIVPDHDATDEDWITWIAAAHDSTTLGRIGDEIRAANAGSVEVRKAYTKKLTALRAQTRVTP